MKKFYSNTSTRLLMTAFALLLTLHSYAGGDSKNYWFYNTVQAYPSGAGVVYMSVTEDEEADRDYKSYYELYFVNKDAISSLKTFNLYAKPNEGYIFTGWRELKAEYWDKLDEDSTIDIRDYMSETVVDPEPETWMSLTTTKSSDDMNTDYYNFIPDNSFVATFGHIMIKYLSGQSAMGTFAIEDPLVDIGGFTYIYAYPADSLTKLLFWIDEDGNKYYGDTLEVSVTHNYTFYPVFDSPEYFTYEFPAEGGYIAYSNMHYDIDYDYNYDSKIPHQLHITGQAYTYTQHKDHTDTIYTTKEIEVDDVIDGRDTFYVVEVPDTVYQDVYVTDTLDLYRDCAFDSIPDYLFMNNLYLSGVEAGHAVLLYGKGYTSFKLEAADTQVMQSTYLQPSGDDGVEIATLSQEDYNYYIWDEANQAFVKVTEGFVPGGSAYLALPVSVVSNPSDTLHVISAEDYENILTGIHTVSAPLLNGSDAVYDIAGRKVAQPEKGLYIVGGRKVLVK